MGRKVNPPCESGSAYQHLDQLLREEPLHQISVLTEHTSMVDTEAIVEEVSKGLVTGATNLQVCVNVMN